MISTIDALVDGIFPPLHINKGQYSSSSGILCTLFYNDYKPDPADPSGPTPSLNGAICDSSTVGRFPIPDAGVGEETIISQIDISASFLSNVGGGGRVMLCDRIWDNCSANGSGWDTSSSGTSSITTPSWGNRDRNGSSDGEGLLLGVEVATSIDSAYQSASLSVSYTNSAGVSGRTAICPTRASTIKGRFTFFGLDSGDTGIRSIESVTLGTAITSGNCKLVVFRPILSFCYSGYNNPTVYDAIKLNFPRVPNDSCLFPIFQPRGSSSPWLGSIQYSQG